MKAFVPGKRIRRQGDVEYILAQLRAPLESKQHLDKNKIYQIISILSEHPLYFRSAENIHYFSLPFLRSCMSIKFSKRTDLNSVMKEMLCS
jgi:hypothetical protein